MSFKLTILLVSLAILVLVGLIILKKKKKKNLDDTDKPPEDIYPLY